MKARVTVCQVRLAEATAMKSDPRVSVPNLRLNQARMSEAKVVALQTNSRWSHRSTLNKHSPVIQSVSGCPKSEKVKDA